MIQRVLELTTLEQWNPASNIGLLCFGYWKFDKDERKELIDTWSGFVNTTKVVLRRVTYFLVGCIRFIDVMALGSLSLSSCCWERSACEKMAQLLAKCIHDKKWKGKCKPLEFGTDFADTATSLLVDPEASRVSFQLLIAPTNTAEAQNRLGNHSKPSSLCCSSLCTRGQRTGKRKSGAWKRSRGQ